MGFTQITENKKTPQKNKDLKWFELLVENIRSAVKYAHFLTFHICTLFLACWIFNSKLWNWCVGYSTGP